MKAMVDRREFLERATCAAAAMAMLGHRTEAAGGMYVSLNASMTRQMEWPEFARLAAQLGYGGVDVNLSAARAQGVEATRALLAELKLTPSVTGLPVQFGAPDAPTTEQLAQLDEAARFLAAIGCHRMMTVLSPASAAPKPDRRRVIKERLLPIAEILQRSNVRLGLEFLGPMYFRTRQPHEFIWRMDEALELAKECGPNVGLTLDAWHWHHVGATAADILAAGKSRIVHIHVSDAKQMPPEDVRDNMRHMPGEGIIDLMGFFQALKKIDYTDGVSPEPIGRVPADMPAEAGARLGLETTVAVMKKAGVM